MKGSKGILLNTPSIRKFSRPPSSEMIERSPSAITHGMSHLVGQVAKGCLADLVLWKPESFGARLRSVNRCLIDLGVHQTQMGDANASIPTVQPVYGRPMWGAQPAAAALNSVLWVSQASINNGKAR